MGRGCKKNERMGEGGAGLRRPAAAERGGGGEEGSGGGRGPRAPCSRRRRRWARPPRRASRSTARRSASPEPRTGRRTPRTAARHRARAPPAAACPAPAPPPSFRRAPPRPRACSWAPRTRSPRPAAPPRTPSPRPPSAPGGRSFARTHGTRPTRRRAPLPYWRTPRPTPRLQARRRRRAAQPPQGCRGRAGRRRWSRCGRGSWRSLGIRSRRWRIGGGGRARRGERPSSPPCGGRRGAPENGGRPATSRGTRCGVRVQERTPRCWSAAVSETSLCALATILGD